MKKLIATLVGIAFFFASSSAFADELKPLPSPHVRLQTGNGELVAPDGTRYFLPMGTHILDGTTFENIDKEMRRLQEQETRLTAEKRSLESGVSWPTILVVGLGALALGFTVNHFVD